MDDLSRYLTDREFVEGYKNGKRVLSNSSDFGTLIRYYSLIDRSKSLGIIINKLISIPDPKRISEILEDMYQILPGIQFLFFSVISRILRLRKKSDSPIDKRDIENIDRCLAEIDRLLSRKTEINPDPLFPGYENRVADLILHTFEKENFIRLQEQFYFSDPREEILDRYSFDNIHMNSKYHNKEGPCPVDFGKLRPMKFDKGLSFFGDYPMILSKSCLRARTIGRKLYTAQQDILRDIEKRFDEYSKDLLASLDKLVQPYVTKANDKMYIEKAINRSLQLFKKRSEGRNGIQRNVYCWTCKKPRDYEGYLARFCAVLSVFCPG